MRALICQTNTTPGDFEGNTKQIIEGIRRGNKEEKLDLIVFPELSIPGYLCKDMMFRQGFVEKNKAYLQQIVQECISPDTYVVVGYIEKNYEGCGKPFRNMAAIIKNRAIVTTYQKRLLPFYDVFDEGRYFEPGKTLTVIEIKELNKSTSEQKWGICICEDLWNDKDMDDYNYQFNPLEEYRRRGIYNIISINSSPYVVGKHMKRVSMVNESSNPAGTVIYCNQLGGQDELVFDGNSFVSHRGNVRVWAKEQPYCLYDSAESPKYNMEVLEHSNIAESYKMLSLGLKDYVNKSGFKEVVVGSSGGIDSAVVIALACDTLGPDKVHGIRMPTKISSNHSKDDARLLHENLGCHDHIVPIEHSPVIDHIVKSINLKRKVDPLADENIQARLRGVTLMYFSNAYGALLLSTGNKTELALGYCVDGESLIFTSDGIFTAKELYDEFQNNSFSTRIKDTRRNETLYLYNNIKTAHKTLKIGAVTIESNIGTRIRTSLDHEIKVFDRLTESYRFKRAEDVAVGDLIVARVGSNHFGNSLELPEWKYEKSKWDYKSAEFIPPIRLTFDLAKFFGVCVADGCYQGKGLYRIRTTKIEVEEFCLGFLNSINLSKSAFKTTAKEEDGSFFIEICSVQFVDWLKYLGIEHGAKNKIVPSCIKKSPSEIIKGFISGVMLDSCTDSTGIFGEIMYHSINEPLTRMVHLMLLNLGVFCYHREWSRKEGYLYEVYIPASETVKLLDGFNFMKSSIKQRILDNVHSPRLKHKAFAGRIYNYRAIENLYRLLGYNRGKGLKRLLYHNNGVGRDTLKQYYNRLNDVEKKAIVAVDIERAINSEDYLVEVTSVKTQRLGSDNPEQMYDFSMEGTPEYNINGHDVHNCTLYGDMNGGFCPINDLYKLDVYAIARYYNANIKKVIPENIINKAPSAELAPGQTDEVALLPYVILDTIVKGYIEHFIADYGKFVSNLPIIEPDSKKWMQVADWTKEFVKANTHRPDAESEYYRILKLIDRSEFKRRQAAPGIKLTKVAFGIGRRLPIVKG